MEDFVKQISDDLEEQLNKEFELFCRRRIATLKNKLASAEEDLNRAIETRDNLNDKLNNITKRDLWEVWKTYDVAHKYSPYEMAIKKLTEV